MLQNFKRYYGAHTGDVGKRFEVMVAMKRN